MPFLNSSSNCHLTDIEITGTVLFDDLTSISGAYGSVAFTHYDVTVDGRVFHPFKNAGETTSQQTKLSFMVYSGSIGSTNLTTNEYFNTEDYRIVSGNYVSQSNTTSSANAWNPQTHMNAANAHGDGMVTVNGYAISPLRIGDDGDTRNTAQGGSLQAPTGNPNYSTLSDDVRTYYRYFRNTTSQDKALISITLYGDANLVAKSGGSYLGALSNNKNINVEIKVPFDPNFSGGDDRSTAWADCIRPFDNGQQPVVDGRGVGNDGESLNQTVPAIGGRTINLNFQEKHIKNNQYFVVKISAHKNWTGYLSRISIGY